MIFEPKYKSAAAESMRKNFNVIFMKVNTDDNPSLMNYYGVNTFPRLLLFKPGDFERPRRFYKDYGLECENLLIWLSEQLTLDLPYRQYCNHNEFACWDGSCCLPLEKVLK